MKEKYGFTLVELLAVIVIIAVIALISSPLILDLIDNTRKEAFVDSGYGIVDSAKTGFVSTLLEEPPVKTVYTYENGVEKRTEGNIKLEYDGAKPQNGTVIINEDGQVSLVIHDGKYCLEKGYNDSKITVTNKSSDECKAPSEVVYFFNKIYGNDKEAFVRIISAPDGYVAIGYYLGYDVNALIVKFDLNGNIVWKKTFGGTQKESYTDIVLANDGFVAIGISTSKDGDLSGMRKGKANGDDIDGLIVKYDFNGNVVWKNTVGGTDMDVLLSSAKSNDGFVILGFSFSNDGDLALFNNSGYSDYIIFKIDSNGQYKINN